MKEVMEELAGVMLQGMTINQALETFHKQLLESSLKLEGGNILRSAKRNKLHRNTMTRQMQRLGVQKITGAGRPWGGKRIACH